MISRLSSCLLYALVGVEDGRVTVAASERYVCHLFSLASSGYSLLFLYFPSFCWNIKEGLVNNWRGDHREWWCPMETLLRQSQEYQQGFLNWAAKISILLICHWPTFWNLLQRYALFLCSPVVLLAIKLWPCCIAGCNNQYAACM
jgi:hypothetical protein